MANKPLTLKQQYMQERRRLQQIVSRETRRGYIFADKVIPDIPKTITKASVSRLSKITPAKIRAKGYVVSEEGELVPSGKAIKLGLTELKNKIETPIINIANEIQPRREKIVKPKVLSEERYTALPYENFRSRVLSMAWAEGGQLLASVLSKLEQAYSDKELSRFISSAIDAGLELKNYMFYKGEEASKVIKELLDFTPLNVSDFKSQSELQYLLDEWDEVEMYK